MRSPSAVAKYLLCEPWVKMCILDFDIDWVLMVFVHDAYPSASRNSSMGKYPVGCVARS
jgi:hypothetical protein